MAKRTRTLPRTPTASARPQGDRPGPHHPYESLLAWATVWGPAGGGAGPTIVDANQARTAAEASTPWMASDEQVFGMVPARRIVVNAAIANQSRSMSASRPKAAELLCGSELKQRAKNRKWDLFQLCQDSSHLEAGRQPARFVPSGEWPHQCALE